MASKTSFNTDSSNTGFRSSKSYARGFGGTRLLNMSYTHYDLNAKWNVDDETTYTERVSKKFGTYSDFYISYTVRTNNPGNRFAILFEKRNTIKTAVRAGGRLIITVPPLKFFPGGPEASFGYPLPDIFANAVNDFLFAIGTGMYFLPVAYTCQMEMSYTAILPFLGITVQSLDWCGFFISGTGFEPLLLVPPDFSINGGPNPGNLVFWAYAKLGDGVVIITDSYNDLTQNVLTGFLDTPLSEFD